MNEAQEVVMCSGSCGKFWPLDDIDKCPWELMTMKKAVRCWECGRALVAAGQAGAGVEAVYQELDPTDRNQDRERERFEACVAPTFS